MLTYIALLSTVVAKHLHVAQHQPAAFDLKQLVVHNAISGSLLDYEQVEYLISLQIGSNKQSFDVMIDTGSSDLWLPAAGAKGFHQLHKDQFFDCSSSTTCQQTNQQLDVYYDDGPIEGTIIWDQVFFDQTVVSHQSMLLVTKAGGNMKNSPGLLGLSFQQISSNPNPTLLNTMVQDKLIPSPMFSLYLTDKGKVGSKIIFGGVDATLQQVPNSPFIYTNLSEPNTYSISLKGIQINGQLVPVTTGLVDSGTSCLTMPSHVIDKVVAMFESEYHIKCKFHEEEYSPSYSLTTCRTKATSEADILQAFPTFHIVIDSQHSLQLSPVDYIYHCKHDSDSTDCLTKLERSKIDSQLILGDAFLQSFYTIFDQANMRLGFSHSINNAELKIKLLSAAHAALAGMFATVLMMI